MPQQRSLNAIGYGSIEEWAANGPRNTPGVTSPTAVKPRDFVTVYLALTSQSHTDTLDAPSGHGPQLTTVRFTIRVARLDEQGDIHYWQQHLGTYPTFDGRTPMFPIDEAESRTHLGALDLIREWLATQGFSKIVNAQVAFPKDLVLLDGHTSFLRYTKNQGWALLTLVPKD